MNKKWIDKQIYWLTAMLSANTSYQKNYDSISELYSYFYSGKTGDAQKAVNLISKHLGMTPPIFHYDWSGELDHDSSLRGQMAKGQLTISLTFTLNKYLLAATVVHELMHYFLIYRKNIRLSDNLENEKTTDLAAIVLGFAVIMLNGKIIDRNKDKVSALGYLDFEELAYACDKINSLRNIKGYSGLTTDGNQIVWGTIKNGNLIHRQNTNSNIGINLAFLKSRKKSIHNLISKHKSREEMKNCPFCRKKIKNRLYICNYCKRVVKEKI